MCNVTVVILPAFVVQAAKMSGTYNISDAQGIGTPDKLVDKLSERWPLAVVKRFLNVQRHLNSACEVLERHLDEGRQVLEKHLDEGRQYLS